MSRNNLRNQLAEKDWLEYQRLRKNLKALKYQLRNIDKVVNWRKRTKKLLIEYKGGKCERCGFNEDVPAAFDFHHKNPKEKDFRIGGSTISLERLKKEVDKCELLCKICHVKEHQKNGYLTQEQHEKSMRKRIRKTEDEIKKLLNV